MEEEVASCLARMDTFCNDLNNGNVDVTEQVVNHRTGQSVMSKKYELLSLHMPELKRKKLGTYAKDGTVTLLTDLALTNEQRTRRGALNFATADAEIKAALASLVALARDTRAVLLQRLTPPPTERGWLQAMGGCLDLRKMILPGSPAAYGSSPAVRQYLDRLCNWMQWRYHGQRAVGAPPRDPSPYDMPASDVVLRQLKILCERLSKAYQGARYRSRWEGKGGIDIMQDVFTTESFYQDCKDFLYLFQHMACKTCCEAVVEGMGGMWDRCSTAARGPIGFETGIEEAVICWSGPRSYHPQAIPFVNRVLNRYFKGGPEKWNFTHADRREERAPQWAGGGRSAGKVVDRLKKTRPRLPASAYGA